MALKLEHYNPAVHDSQLVATLIYLADQEFNAMVYGNLDEGVEAIKSMMQMEYNYFTYPHLKCAVHDGAVVGVLAGYEGKDKAKLDQVSGKAFAKAFGFWSLIRRMPTFMRMANISWKNIDHDGYMVNTLCVAPEHRGKGFGSKMLHILLSEYDKVYLDVNMSNLKGQNFYRKHGFAVHSKGMMNYKGKEVGLYSMKKG